MDQLLKTLNITVNEPQLMDCALTHKSHPAASDYERLEFLGDRVLNLSVANLLYKTFPEYTEGQLAKHHAALVREETLAQVAQTWELEKVVKLGKSAQEEDGPRPSILADVVEAILGAIFLDQGFETAEKIVKTFWDSLIHTVDILDPKSTLQEALQSQGHPLPMYKVIDSSGKDHNKSFTIEVSSPLGKASAEGTSKQKAAQLAAKKLLEQLKID